MDRKRSQNDKSIAFAIKWSSQQLYIVRRIENAKSKQYHTPNAEKHDEKFALIKISY